MTHIKIKKGLDIPIEGAPEGFASSLTSPHQIALDLTPFDEITFKLLVRLEEKVKLGQPLLEDKNSPGRFFVAPAAGIVREIRRGLKRRLLDIVIEVAKEEEIERHSPFNFSLFTRQELVERLKLGGLFAFIRQRPFNVLADPQKIPRSIFVKALESAPFTPPAEMQVAGYEKEFQLGLEALAKLADGGPVHLIHRQDTSSRAFLDAKGVHRHTAEGPHPSPMLLYIYRNSIPFKRLKR